MVEAKLARTAIAISSLIVQRFYALLAAGLVLAGCTSETAAPDEQEQLQSEPPSSLASTTTMAPVNRPPEIRVATLARAEIGDRLTDSIVAFDPEGDDVVVRVSDGPAGFAPVVNARGRIIGFEWEPAEPGEWDVVVSGTDPSGLSSEVTVRLVSRHAREVDLILAMGDSIAAGFGRDRSDFLGDDECFRSEPDAYGLEVGRTLTDVGSLTADAAALLVACTGASVDDLSLDPVIPTRADGSEIEDQARSQLQWATDLNPTIITLTVGGSDLGLLDAEALERHTAEPDAARLEADLMTFETGLRDLLERLATTTDAHIAITTYYDPTAADPIGTDICPDQCFAAAVAGLVSALNDRILSAVEAVDPARTTIVRLDGEYDVWEADNALGPDALRDGLGPLQGLVDRFTGGSQATCADDSTSAEDLVSALDCLHPNERGHDQLAKRVSDELLSL